MQPGHRRIGRLVHAGAASAWGARMPARQKGVSAEPSGMDPGGAPTYAAAEAPAAVVAAAAETGREPGGVPL